MSEDGYYDLSTYEGRQVARDDGHYVGDDGNGGLIVEYADGTVEGTGSAPAGDGGGGGDDGGGGSYSTPNGEKTLAQMEAELYAVGWGGDGNVVDVYNRTASGGGGGGGGTAVSASVDSGGMPAYSGGTSTPTGLSGGTAPQQQQQAGTSGTNPVIAQAQMQQATEYARMEYEKAWRQLQFTQLSAYQKEEIALKSAAQASEDWWRKEQMRQKSVELGQQGALGLLNVAKDLRGPRNAFQMLKVMGQTPNGLRDLVRAMGGAYRVPGMAGANGTPEAANLTNFMTDVTANNQQQQWDSAMTDMQGMPAPNQVDVANWNKMPRYGKDMALAAYEAGGWDPSVVEDAIKTAAPEFKTPEYGSITW